jgi:hypothetical protein
MVGSLPTSHPSSENRSRSCPAAVDGQGVSNLKMLFEDLTADGWTRAIDVVRTMTG